MFPIYQRAFLVNANFIFIWNSLSKNQHFQIISAVVWFTVSEVINYLEFIAYLNKI